MICGPRRQICGSERQSRVFHLDTCVRAVPEGAFTTSPARKTSPARERLFTMFASISTVGAPIGQVSTWCLIRNVCHRGMYFRPNLCRKNQFTTSPARESLSTTFASISTAAAPIGKVSTWCLIRKSVNPGSLAKPLERQSIYYGK